MELPILENILFLTFLHGISTFMLFTAALVVSSAIRLNKGARSNRSMLFIAISLILFGLAEGNQFLEHLGTSIPEGWDHIKIVVGSIFMLLGVLHWRGLLKGMLK